MAEWKERGYVPDSDDEEEEGPELLSREGSILSTKPSAEQEGERLGSDNHEKLLSPGAQSQKLSLTEDEHPTSLADVQDHDLAPPRDGSQLVLQWAENERSSGNGKKKEEAHENALPNLDSATIDLTRIVEARSSVVEQLRNELRSGLDIVKEVLGGSPAIVGGRFDDRSGSSSPLSSARSCSFEDDSGKDIPEAASEGAMPLNNWSSEQHFAGSVEARPNSIVEFDSGAQLTRRNFRQRNPIQLHPYALEGARYQQELLARGVKPIYVAGSLRRSNSEAFETQDCDFREDDAGDKLQDIPSSQQERSGPLQPIHNGATRKRPRRRSTNPVASDGELPDLDAILEGKDAGIPQARTRSKGTYRAPQIVQNEDGGKDFDIYDLPSDHAGFTLGRRENDAVFRVPPSPAHTHSLGSSQSAVSLSGPPTRKLPAWRRTPQALPTPNISSAAQRPTELALPFDDDSDSPEIGEADSGSTSSLHSLEQGDSHILQLQRKTKGVLPASFFRLQIQQKKGRSNQVRRGSLSPERDLDGPGVAHSLSRARDPQTSPSRATNNAIVVSDDSSSDEHSVSDTFDYPAASEFANEYDEIMGLVHGDIEEDNGIDMMIQPQSRKRKLPDNAQKRQRRINEFSHDVNDDVRSGRSRRTRTPKRRKEPLHPSPGGERRKRTSLKARSLSLGPLDAPGYTDLPRVKQPNFLRVAARRAGSRKSGRRQNPDRKCIRLATSTDTYDANSELRNWRNGLLQKNAKPRSSPSFMKCGQFSRDQPLDQELQRGLFSGNGQIYVSLEMSPSRRAKQPSPLRFRTEDVIQEIVLRRTGHSYANSPHSKRPLLRAANDHAIGPLRSSTAVHEQHGNRSGRGMLLSSTIGFARPREAQFESLGLSKTRHRVLNAFRGSSSDHQSVESPNAVIVAQSARASGGNVKGPGVDTTVKDAPKRAFPRAFRKRPPRQVEITSLSPPWRPEASEEGFNADYHDVEALSGIVLAGLGSPDFPITNNFGVIPFREGIYLHKASFIGEGHLSQVIRNLAHQPRSLIQGTADVFGVTRPSLASPPYRWGVWDDHTSEQFSTWFLELRDCLIIQSAQDNGLPHGELQNAVAAFKSFICYLSQHASFRNRQGLVAFAENAISASQDLVLQIEGQFKSNSSSASPEIIRLSGLLLVFIFEIACILAATDVERRIQIKACKTFQAFALVVLKSFLRRDRLAKVVSFSSPGCDMLSTGHDNPELDVLVAINNLSKQTIIHTDIWDLIAEALRSSIGSEPENLVKFQDYDCWWKGIFSALPSLELDSSGLLQRWSGSPGWDLVQRLLVRFLHLFMPQRQNTGYSTKHYGRILIQRCFELVRVWGWQGGHSAIGTLFDAYSSNDMNEMFGERPEQPFYIPLNLAPGTRIHVAKSDSGFHAFLGLLTQTILDSRKPDADVKLTKRVLRSLSARLIPTKGEDISKNKSPSAHDMFALRNRFDLISVMYCAMPTELKPNLRLFQTFVDIRNAPRAASKLALECWSRLVQHEAFHGVTINLAELETSNDQPPSNLSLLKEWLDLMVTDLLAEYTSTDQGAVGLVEHQPTNHAEPRYILSDKRDPVAEVLKEALKTWEQSLGFCRNARQATELFSQRILEEVLKLFDAEQPASNAVLSAVLQIVRAYTRKSVPHTTHAAPVDEDSQEYGSWDHFDGMAFDDQDHSNPRNDGSDYLLQEVHSVLRRFLSDVFGSDITPDHAILKNTVDCWYEIADALVRVKVRSWCDFIGQYSTDAWESLRDTRQTQQYKIYFLAKVVDSDFGFYEGDRLHILEMWISALCRPKDFLCWEHLLTSMILFQDSDNELLFNPPFAVHSDTGDRLEISMAELRERRTAMIYVVLRNMHRLLTTPARSSQTSLLYSKASFREILKSLESTMKTFYQELEANQQAQNEYRTFLNFVVQQMQLYVVDFHKIDPFFTDPAISSAEAYAITASLKRHSLTVETTGITKAMVLFLYNASERAAADDTQENLILQLYNAWLDLSQDAIERTENHGADQALLVLFLQNVFPAYIGHAFSAPGHIIAWPLLRVLTHVYENLRCRSDFWNPSSFQHLTGATELILSSALNTLSRCPSVDILSCFHRLDNFNELVDFVHSAMLRTYEAAQAFPNNVDCGNIIEILLALKDQITAVEQPSGLDHYILDMDADPKTVADLTVEHSAIRSYAERELQNALDKTWRQGQSGGWEIIGRGTPKVVRASRRPSSRVAAETEMEQCKERTRFVVREFMEAFVRLDWWE